MIKRIATLFLLFFITVMISRQAVAQCVPSFPAGGGSFGSASSFQVKEGSLSTSLNLSLKCDLVLLSLLSTDNVGVTFTGASNMNGNQATLKVSAASGSDNVPLNICTTTNCATPLTQGNTATFSSSTLATLLSASTFTIPFYFQTTTGQNIAAGQYSVTLNLTVTWNICGTLGIGSICINEQKGSTILSATLILTVTNDCITISAPDINFGSAPLIGGFSSVAQNISVTCTKGSIYTVGIDNGRNALNGVRYMSNGSSRIAYDIWQGTTTSQRWGSVGSQRWASNTATSISADQLTRNYRYLAKILDGQTTPSSGTYSDTVTVDIAF